MFKRAGGNFYFRFTETLRVNYGKWGYLQFPKHPTLPLSQIDNSLVDLLIQAIFTE
jgi:hypothetical protein